MNLLYPFALISAVTFSCKLTKEQPVSDVNVVNGRETNEGEFPAVIQIKTNMGGGMSAMCTASWVSDQTVITAAHCVDEAIDARAPSRVSVRHGSGTGAVATALYHYPNWNSEHDVAVLTFPKGTSKSWLAIVEKQASVGDKLSIVGYGKNDHLNSRSGGVRRTGHNTVIEISSRGTISFDGYVSPNGNDGTRVTNSQGDSGGPLIINGKLAGVSSTVSPNYPKQGNNRGNYEGMRAPKVEAWLKGLAAKGVKIVGLSEGTEGAGSTQDNKLKNGNKPEIIEIEPESKKETPEKNDSIADKAPQENSLLGCNADYRTIISGKSSGICLNKSSGFCYKYAKGQIQYGQGRVSCPKLPILAETPADPSTKGLCLLNSRKSTTQYCLEDYSYKGCTDWGEKSSDWTSEWKTSGKCIKEFPEKNI